METALKSLSQLPPAVSETFEFSFRVLELHLDTFGHVNNAQYFTLFEQARWEFITQNGFGLSTIQQKKQGPIVLSAQINYLAELKLRDSIKIVSYLSDYQHKVGKIIQYMLRDDVLCCTVQFDFGFFDMRGRKLIDPTPEWLRAVGMAQDT